MSQDDAPHATWVSTKSISGLIRALKIYYCAGDDELNRLAENEYSQCASTQRGNPHELRDLLEVFK